jgi:tRNA A-37 threonylcarbamoyl transferase component Bud32
MGMKKDFGPFELHEKIGSGGMASVYLGIQKSLDRPVVLKVLYPHLAEDEKLVARFEREARAAANLRHENVVQVIDCGRHEDLSYIAMEFVEGLNLKQWMETYGTPPVEMALLMLRDICRGLEHAHQNRIVHRDIKPANIMLTPEGTIKIMDFGLARRGEDTTAVTVVGSVLGTPAYMSPEQATGEAVDERSDVFSCGVVGYELLGGKRPFQGDSYSTVLRAILTIEPPPLESFNPLVPEEVVKIIHRMLAKDVSKRAPSVATVRGDLESVVEQMGLHRGKDLLREYAQDPKRVGEVLRKKRLGRHLDQGLFFENMGLSKIDDALLEFRRVLFLEPENPTAREHLKKLERERERLLAEQKAQGGDDRTLLLDAQTAGDATLVLGAGAPAAKAPAAKPKAAAKPEAARKSAGRAEPATASVASTTRNLVLAVAALLVVAAVAAVALWPRGSTSEQNGEPAPSGTEPPASATTQVEPPSREPTPSEPSPPEPPPATTAAEPAPVATTAALVVNTDPPQAKIIVDGVSQARRSNATLPEVAPGEHVVRVEKEGYQSQERRVTLAAGGEERMSFTLQPAVGLDGTLEIRVTPFATFFVNDKQVDANKVSTKTTLKPGRYTVRAVHPAFAPKEWSNVVIEPGKTRQLTHDFTAATTPQTGSIRVTSGGIWAYVYVNGQNTGKTTPCVISDLAAGNYAVSLFREGFAMEGNARTVTVKGGLTADVSIPIKQR